ncbi:MAG: hypothetical protein H0T51_22545 [Pirellulales bacterium]|nr:hypothetical protein [Pirellulales bacterium]
MSTIGTGITWRCAPTSIRRRILHELSGGAFSHLMADHGDGLIQLPRDFIAGALTTQDSVGDQDVVGKIPRILLLSTGVPLIAIQ